MNIHEMAHHSHDLSPTRPLRWDHEDVVSIWVFVGINPIEPITRDPDGIYSVNAKEWKLKPRLSLQPPRPHINRQHY